jgi:hypothetical protein
MMSDNFAFAVLFFGGIATVMAITWSFCEPHLLSAAFTALSLVVMVLTIIGVNNALKRTVPAQPVYYAVKDVGTVEAPQDVAVIHGIVFDITDQLKVVLYNPELYYLEEQPYSCPCEGWCMMTHEKPSTYRVVPRSLIEVQ